MIGKDNVDKIGVITVDGRSYMGEVNSSGDTLTITNAYPIDSEITLKKLDVYFRKFNKDELDTITMNGVKGYTTRGIRKDEKKLIKQAWDAMETALEYVDADSVNRYFQRQLGTNEQ